MNLDMTERMQHQTKSPISLSYEKWSSYKVVRQSSSLSSLKSSNECKPICYNRSITYPHSATKSSYYYHSNKRIMLQSGRDKEISKDDGISISRRTYRKKTVSFDPKINRWHNGLGTDSIPTISRLQEK